MARAILGANGETEAQYLQPNSSYKEHGASRGPGCQQSLALLRLVLSSVALALQTRPPTPCADVYRAERQINAGQEGAEPQRRVHG